MCCSSQNFDSVDVMFWLITRTVFKLWIILLFLINHLNLLYLPGVLYYLVYLLSYSLIIQNLGIYMYMGQSIVSF